MSDHLTLTAVKARGWSPKLIERVLGGPDKLAPNPYRRSGPKVKLWLVDRVAEAESHPDFVAHQSNRAQASQRSKATADRKRSELLAAIEAMDIVVAAIPLDELQTRAIEDWEAWRIDRGDYGIDGSQADDTTKTRWMVNFARHRLCSYDRDLEDVAGKIGVRDAVTAIRRKVYAEIASIYPSLASECARQAADRSAT